MHRARLDNSTPFICKKILICKQRLSQHKLSGRIQPTHEIARELPVNLMLLNSHHKLLPNVRCISKSITPRPICRSRRVPELWARMLLLLATFGLLRTRFMDIVLPKLEKLHCVLADLEDGFDGAVGEQGLGECGTRADAVLEDDEGVVPVRGSGFGGVDWGRDAGLAVAWHSDAAVVVVVVVHCRDLIAGVYLLMELV